jgi:hypothetical protein
MRVPQNHPLFFDAPMSAFGTSRLTPDGRFRITSTVEEIAEPRAIAG